MVYAEEKIGLKLVKMMQKFLLLLCLITFRSFAMDHESISGSYDMHAIEVRKTFFYETAEKRFAAKQDLDAPIVAGDITLLQYFASRDASMVKRLLAAGATPSAVALGSILRYPQLIPGFESAQELLKYNPRLANETYERNTFLHMLCVTDYNVYNPSKVAFVKLLLSYKANPNTFDTNQKTPIYYLIVGALPMDQEVQTIWQSKQIIYALIFHGAHLKTVKNDPDRLCAKLVEASEHVDLARYAERTYVFRMLKLMRKSSQYNLVKLLPNDVIKYISQKA